MSSIFARVFPGVRTRLKNLMPRTLYGRAALILVVPIVTIQLVVSIVFIQRHYEDVTVQMTGNVLRELTWVLEQVEAQDSVAGAEAFLQAVTVPLDFQTGFSGDPGPQADRYLFYDLSASIVISTLRAGLPQIGGVDLESDNGVVRFALPTRHGVLHVQFSRSRVSARNPHQLLVLMMFTSLLMTAVAYIFLRNQMRPIKKLAEASEAFGKGQWMNYTPRGASEVRAAGGAFLAMRSRIERQIEQRTMMLSGVSHDLRTPITRLKLSLSMMEDDEEAGAMQEDIADMERLIDSFLNFARGDAADEIADCDPVAIVQESVEKARRNGADVKMTLPDHVPLSALRPQAIARALDNLISNGLRYGSKVRIALLMHDRSFVFRVEDNGPGIAPEDRAEAVKPFVRLEPSRNQNKSSAGTGLGLAIAFDIARTHGGSLRLGESPALGGLMVDLIVAR